MSKKQLFTLEFPVKCSPGILYEFLATPAGLQEWFADKVDEWDNVYSFSWNGEKPDKAEVVEKEHDKFIRYHWLHSEKGEYFEFRIEKTEISNQTVLLVKDFAEKSDIRDQSRLWEYQLKELFHRIGSN
ncbi:MAG: START-like domain-containing protein [Sediminibacterium sp.]